MTDILRISCKSSPRSAWRPVLTFDPARLAEAREMIAAAQRLDPVAQWRVETRGGRPVP